MAMCDYLLNLSQANSSYANTTSEIRDDFVISCETLFFLEQILRYIFYVVGSSGLIMNFLNIIAILHAPGKMTPHTLLVLNLAISDICLLLPEVFIRIFETLPYDINIPLYYTLLHKYIEPAFILASLLNLLSLGIDHYIAIVKPLYYNRIVSKRHTSACIVLIWILSVVASAIETIPEIIKYYRGYEIQYTITSIWIHMFRFYQPKLPYILVIFELIVLIILYIRIYVAYKDHVTRRQLFRPDEQHSHKAFITTLFIIMTFMIGWVPYSIIQILLLSTRHHPYTTLPIEYEYFIVILCKSLIFLNASCDALIYSLRLDVVKQGYKLLLRRLRRHVQFCLWNAERSNSIELRNTEHSRNNHSMFHVF